MAKLHTYPDQEEEPELPDPDYEKLREFVGKCLESIEDLMQEVASGAVTLSLEQEEEMENLLKDARKMGLP